MKINVNFTDVFLLVSFFFLSILTCVLAGRFHVKVVDACELENYKNDYVKVCFSKTSIKKGHNFVRIYILDNSSKACGELIIFSRDVNMNLMSRNIICAEGEVNYNGIMVVKKLYICEDNLLCLQQHPFQTPSSHQES